jgi:hemerythrin-like metal-binding protein
MEDAFDRFQHYKLGITVLDDEHWELIRLLRNVELVKFGDKASLLDAVEVVIRTFEDHLVAEEATMRELEYPFMTYHRLHHAEFFAILTRYRTTCKPATVDPSVIKYIARSLSVQFLQHIDQYDRQLARFILKNADPTS